MGPYRESGHFNLSGQAPAQLDPLEHSDAKVGVQGASLAGLSCHAVFPSDRGVEAAVSMMRVDDSAWMLHQIAKRRGAPRRVLLDRDRAGIRVRLEVGARILAPHALERLRDRGEVR